MRCPRLAELPPPPSGKAGWPWTIETPLLPTMRPDGSHWPRISIVTTSYNQGQFIEETIRSILLQGYPDVEYIIIDGGSTDESVKIIKKYQPWLTYWVSESDRGQTHAINKGLALTTGKLFNWINSDDLLLPRALAVVGSGTGSAIAGGVINFANGHGETIVNRNLSPTLLIKGVPGTVFQQPGFWFARANIGKCGGINEQFSLVFDFDLLIRYLFVFPQVQYVHFALAKFRLHCNSKTCSQQDNFHLERLRVYETLASDPTYSPLQRCCRRRSQAYDWWASLERIAKSNKSRLLKAAEIVAAMMLDPSIRVSRLSFGMVRKVLFFSEQ